MLGFQHIVQDIRNGEPLPLHIDLLLRAATPITRLGMAQRLRKTPQKVDVPVIAFGNLTAGGTGKTPAVIERVKQETARGHKVAVVTRGYGTQPARRPQFADPDLTNAELARTAGDEPALIRHHVPEAFIIKSVDRTWGARFAIERFGCTMIVLDDAFQHVALARDENVCLIDATNPFGNGHLVPRGILREPLTAIERATHIMLTRCDQARNLDELRIRLAELAPGIPVRETVHAPGRFWNLATGETVASLAGEPVTAICGIGNPEAFFQTLDTLGLDVTESLAYPDHGEIPPKALGRSGTIVTTEKDAMRLASPHDRVYALEVKLEDYVEG